MVLLNDDLWFPPVRSASAEGLLAIGGDLSLERLKLAYNSGIFPWYEEGQPILWWSPDPRMVLVPNELHISKTLQKTIRSGVFKITVNQNFSEVIQQCAKITRKGQKGTWITAEMVSAYEILHQKGIAVSIEVWKDDELVGGLYGIDLPEKKIFCGESMFTKVSDASKVGFCFWVEKLLNRGYKLIDCQVYTQHLERFGAKEIPRAEFMQFIEC
ncbi:leucyl/phenylalanyl-tRNA--protein transferase [Luteirhabdus pelagi]|uniref:leucyl/phenylalanyl-tRNA--protein transferase n=1 Tax=Luteirhabdus pelagi TaxID=2792783 RepID=UPI001939B125|nr:leucyl/phenylalanyl-tRNA--protein transferase [Luteirhabdus pelagi]